ncbi:hypothetical protein [Desulfovibrio piger]|uniref:Uncharacterized protein n=1 Tax=Desulfovibrio piger ATCC 29098 TaxID=411464 RepID=B6WT94_9BACT|nr:hypothetical protein [Desulfovibrio piger]EEB33784.1 hypothetical protein DESPIG_01299 [Desulfovibrio piger ATCC 29098]
MMKNISECIPVLQYDGEMFIGFMLSTCSIYYQIGDEDGNVIWKVLNCSNCHTSLLEYLQGKLSLKVLYQRALGSYEIEREKGRLDSYSYELSEDEIPYDDSSLYSPAENAYNALTKLIESNYKSFILSDYKQKITFYKSFSISNYKQNYISNDFDIFKSFERILKQHKEHDTFEYSNSIHVQMNWEKSFSTQLSL